MTKEQKRVFKEIFNEIILIQKKVKLRLIKDKRKKKTKRNNKNITKKENEKIGGRDGSCEEIYRLK